MSKWRGTVSKALLMSIAASSDLCAGLCWLKPSVMFCVRLVSSVLNTLHTPSQQDRKLEID